jgi:hypothetical protein
MASGYGGTPCALTGLVGSQVNNTQSKRRSARKGMTLDGVTLSKFGSVASKLREPI